MRQPRGGSGLAAAVAGEAPLARRAHRARLRLERLAGLRAAATRVWKPGAQGLLGGRVLATGLPRGASGLPEDSRVGRAERSLSGTTLLLDRAGDSRAWRTARASIKPNRGDLFRTVLSASACYIRSGDLPASGRSHVDVHLPRNSLSGLRGAGCADFIPEGCGPVCGRNLPPGCSCALLAGRAVSLPARPGR